MMTVSHEPAGATAESCVLTPAAESCVLTPAAESTPAFVRDLGPALAPVADAMEALRADTATDLAIERVARVVAAEGYTATELRAVAGDCDLYLRIADAVEALEITVPEMAE